MNTRDEKRAMMARLQAISDYDEVSKTYTVVLVVDESEIDFDGFKDGEEVKILKSSNDKVRV